MILTINHNVFTNVFLLIVSTCGMLLYPSLKLYRPFRMHGQPQTPGPQTSLLYGLYVYPLAVPCLLIKKSIECWVPSPTCTCKTNSVGYKLLHVLYTYTNIFGYR